MDTEAIAIIASSTVAIAAIVAGWLDHRATREQARELADLENVRDVLDSAAELLHRTSYALDGVRVNLIQYGAGFFAHEPAVEHHDDLTRCGQEADALSARLKVRLGSEHAAVQHFVEADEVMLSMHQALGQIRLMADPPPDPNARDQVEDFVDEKREHMVRQREVFDRARKEFEDTAFSAAGLRLPPSTA